MAENTENNNNNDENAEDGEENLPDASNFAVLVPTPKRRRRGRDGKHFAVRSYGVSPIRKKRRTNSSTSVAAPVTRRVTRSMSAAEAEAAVARDID